MNTQPLREFFFNNIIQNENLTATKLRTNLRNIILNILKYCTYKRVPIYRFNSLRYLYHEVNTFPLMNEDEDNDKLCDWSIKELFTGLQKNNNYTSIPTLLEKVEELKIQKPEKFIQDLLDSICHLRREIIEGRTNKEVYILYMDIVDSGSYMDEEQALYDFPDIKKYCEGLEKITHAFTFIKQKIELKDGIILSEAGDSILAAFDNIENAVYVAYILQKSIKKAKEYDVKYRMGIGKGNLCIIDRNSRYSYSIVEAVRTTSRMKNHGILIFQNCFCQLISNKINNENNEVYTELCRNCNAFRKEVKEKRDIYWKEKVKKLKKCLILDNPKTTWPIEIPLLDDINIKVMPRGYISLKHTVHNLFEVLIDDEQCVIL